MSESEGEDGGNELDALMAEISALPNSGQDNTKKPVRKKIKDKRKRKLKSATVRSHLPDDMFEYDWPPCACGRNHPPVPHFTPPDDKLCTYYWQIADLFPFMTLHRVINTEIMFQRADADQSGVIEENELQFILTKTIGGDDLSSAVIQKTFTEIDTDHSGTIDFVEVLAVMDNLIQRRETNIPKKVKEDYSKVCSLQ